MPTVIFAMAAQQVRPGESMAATWTRFGTFSEARMMKSPCFSELRTPAKDVIT